ncbi:MAG: hypothetical protein VCA55_12045 [Verrucomicrobiales bacterium]|jgi:hypothetical protein
MDITDEQKAAVTAWVQQGEDLSAIQSRLKDELDITLTYVDTRFLLADLGLELTDDAEDDDESTIPETDDAAREPAEDEPGSDDAGDATDTPPVDDSPSGAAGEVSVTVDSLTRVGTEFSGKVTFSDGECAAWHIDRTGQPRLDPVKEDYRPSEEDIAKFLAELHKALR